MFSRKDTNRYELISLSLSLSLSLSRPGTIALRAIKRRTWKTLLNTTITRNYLILSRRNNYVSLRKQLQPPVQKIHRYLNRAYPQSLSPLNLQLSLPARSKLIQTPCCRASTLHAHAHENSREIFLHSPFLSNMYLYISFRVFCLKCNYLLSYIRRRNNSFHKFIWTNVLFFFSLRMKLCVSR